ncbi:MAG: ankyrin repeat domain-containing protein [Promethearchaeota archaeon]
MEREKRRSLIQGGRNKSKIRAIDKEGHVREFESFDQFFVLPWFLQEQMMLTIDPKTVFNLCKAASTSNREDVREFYNKYCRNYKFWVKRFQMDFPDNYRLTILRFYEQLTESIGADHLFTISPTELKMNTESEEAQRFMFTHWKDEYVIYYGLLHDEFVETVVQNKMGVDIRRFLRLGLDPNITGERSRAIPDMGRREFWEVPLLNIAVEKQNIDFIRALLVFGADPNGVDTSDGKTALHEATMLNNPTIVESLLAREETFVDQQDDQGQTALYIAVTHGLSTVTQLLLEAGANGDEEANDRTTPYSQAQTTGAAHMMDMINKIKGRNIGVHKRETERPLLLRGDDVGTLRGWLE